jgi:hypothetical protein
MVMRTPLVIRAPRRTAPQSLPRAYRASRQPRPIPPQTRPQARKPCEAARAPPEPPFTHANRSPESVRSRRLTPRRPQNSRAAPQVHPGRATPFTSRADHQKPTRSAREGVQFSTLLHSSARSGAKVKASPTAPALRCFAYAAARASTPRAVAAADLLCEPKRGPKRGHRAVPVAHHKGDVARRVAAAWRAVARCVSRAQRRRARACASAPTEQPSFSEHDTRPPLLHSGGYLPGAMSAHAAAPTVLVSVPRGRVHAPLRRALAARPSLAMLPGCSLLRTRRRRGACVCAAFAVRVRPGDAAVRRTA